MRVLSVQDLRKFVHNCSSYSLTWSLSCSIVWYRTPSFRQFHVLPHVFRSFAFSSRSYCHAKSWRACSCPNNHSRSESPRFPSQFATNHVFIPGNGRSISHKFSGSFSCFRIGGVDRLSISNFFLFSEKFAFLLHELSTMWDKYYHDDAFAFCTILRGTCKFSQVNELEPRQRCP